MNGIDRLAQAFSDYLSTTFGVTDVVARTCALLLNVDEAKQQFGDLNSNAAMVLAKQLKRAPREIAGQIAGEFKNTDVENIEIAGPGFLNFFLTSQAIGGLAGELFQKREQFFKPKDLTPQNVSIEFVSANPTGPLHFGHGRGGIIGDVLGNVLKFIGHNVTKEFYINDAGTQIQRLGVSLKARCKQELGQDRPVPEDGYQGEYLIETARMCIKEHGKNVIEQPDTFFQDYAKTMLLARITETLTTYGIQFDVWFSEKTLHEDGSIERSLAWLKEHGHLYEKDGATWFKSTSFGDDKDRVVRKADGELTYVAADIAYMKNKIDRGAQHLVMILGHDHHGYVQRLHGLHAALELQEYPLDIILYQLVKMKEGGKQLRMSKRAGTMVTLHDIIDTVGTDVARFFYLNRKADAQLEFDIELALTRSEENPVYYVQYAYVRTGSILTKAAEQEEYASISTDDATFLGREEAPLIKKIVALGDIVTTVAHNNQTHQLTYYALELAQLFSKYYAKHRVIDPTSSKQTRARLLLISTLRTTFATIFDLLGISKPTSM